MFWKNKNICPITEEDKVWLEDSLLWFEEAFGKYYLKSREVFLPTKSEFNWDFRGNEEDAFYILDKLANSMDINTSSISLEFFKEPTQIQYEEGIISQFDDYRPSAGRYIEYSDGKIEILIEYNQLKNPQSLIATMAHELAHFKLLGEKRMVSNDEFLTDLAVIVFGYGIFSTNTAITKMHTWSGSSHSGWQVTGGDGYLHFKVQAFALALFANYIEKEDLQISSFLEKDASKIYDRGLTYIEANKEDIRFR